MASKEELLSLEGCASFLDLPKATIYRKVRKNEIPYMKRGGRLYFSRTQLIELNNMTNKHERDMYSDIEVIDETQRKLPEIALECAIYNAAGINQHPIKKHDTKIIRKNSPKIAATWGFKEGIKLYNEFQRFNSATKRKDVHKLSSTTYQHKREMFEKVLKNLQGAEAKKILLTSLEALDREWTKKQEINIGLEAANRLNGVIIEHYLPHIKLSLARIADALEDHNRILKNKGE